MEKFSLGEISLLRPIIILLLVLMHSFTMFNGSWELPEGVSQVCFYKWIPALIMGCMLELFVFISGYIYSFQRYTLNKQYTFKYMIKKKFRRLMYPSIFFSFIYYFLYRYESNSFNILDFIIRILSGVGHMWFLPMLFWCFISIWIIEKIRINKKTIFVVLMFISIIPLAYLPLGLVSLPHYIFYFYLGYLSYEYKNRLLNFLFKKRIYTYFGVFTYIVFVVIYQNLFFKYKVESLDYTFIMKFMNLLLLNLIKLIPSVIGIIVAFILAIRFSDKICFIHNNYIEEANRISFGIYIYHQFILIYLYYHTFLPLTVSSYILPWFGFIISFIVSVILSKVTLNFRFGRSLLN